MTDRSDVNSLRAEVEDLRHKLHVARSYMKHRDDVIDGWCARDKANRWMLRRYGFNGDAMEHYKP